MKPITPRPKPAKKQLKKPRTVWLTDTQLREANAKARSLRISFSALVGLAVQQYRYRER